MLILKIIKNVIKDNVNISLIFLNDIKNNKKNAIKTI